MSDPNQLLWKAIKKGSLSKAQGALDQGADPNTVKNGMTPLLYAVWEKHTEIVKLLCEKGANVNYQHPDTRDSALIMAVAGGDLEIVRTLCSFGADKMLQTVDGKTAFDFVDEDSNTFSQIETILETCGISDPNLPNRYVSVQNGMNDPKLLEASENTDPQGGNRRKRRTRRRISKRRKSSNRSRRG
jgi:ankyrin repeat protein